MLHLRNRPGSNGPDERAISIAAGLARIAESRGVEYALAVPLTRLLVHPRRGGGHLARLTTDLGLLELGPDDGRGARCAFPPQAAGMGSSCIVVHSGGLDPGFAPRGAQISHIVATELDGAAVHSPARPITLREGAHRGA